jgi:hypothetical protein
MFVAGMRRSSRMSVPIFRCHQKSFGGSGTSETSTPKAARTTASQRRSMGRRSVLIADKEALSVAHM